MKALVLAMAVVATAPAAFAGEQCGNGEAYPCTPKSYGVPQLIKDLNASAKRAGLKPPVEPCGAGELYPCEVKVFGVPRFLRDLNEWAKRHGGRPVDPATTDWPHGP